jgi:hypothetical protein
VCDFRRVTQSCRWIRPEVAENRAPPSCDPAPRWTLPGKERNAFLFTREGGRASDSLLCRPPPSPDQARASPWHQTFEAAPCSFA